jgi:hypothetical protein
MTETKAEKEPSPEALARRVYATIVLFGWDISWKHDKPVPDDAWPIDIITRALDAFRREGVGWQPIETMPDAIRFDEVVLLFKPDERRSGASRFVGYWDDQASGWTPVYGPYVVENVTHWMPLLEPPQ